MKADPNMLLPLLVDGTLEHTLLHGKFTYLTRADVLMQAISLTRAQMTGAWLAEAAPVRTPEFNFADIYRNVLHITEMMARWEYLFAFHGLTPLRITYEEIDAGIQTVIGRIAVHIDISAPMLPESPPRQLQRDDVSVAWKRQFLEILGQT